MFLMGGAMLATMSGAVFSVRMLCVLLSFAVLPACQGLENDYLQNGVGSELAAPDIDKATRNQNIYFSHLCAQAGASADCNAIPSIDKSAWTMIVRQGMNDVDRRCDAYLQWLDNRRRSRGPILSQVRDVGSATAAIVGAVDPDNGVALQVLAASFNLITRSLENYNSRLLLEVDSSTINSVVLRARNDFRLNVRTAQYETRPDAEFVLRSYLRLCLPFAIETNINNYTTLAAQGIPVDFNNSINTFPAQVIGPTAGGVERQFRPGDRPPVDPVPKSLPEAKTAWERSLLPGDLRTIQYYLCIKKPAPRFGDETRAAISLWFEAKARPQEPGGLNTRDGPTLLSEARSGKACDKTHYRNIYERIQLSDPAVEAKFIAALAKIMKSAAEATSITTLKDARGLIQQALIDHKEWQRQGFVPDEITPTMLKVVQAQEQ
jgi:hypothetical protein